MKPTPAGQRRHSAIIQRPVDAKNPNNENWLDVDRDDFKIAPVGGAEMMAWGNEMVATQLHQINMRFRPDVDTTCRILFEGRKLNFISLQNVEELNVEINVLAKERLS